MLPFSWPMALPRVTPALSSPAAVRAARPKDYVVIARAISYKDGGTVELRTNRGTFYLDKRLGTKTAGKLFDRYPEDKGAKLVTDARIIQSIADQYEV